MAYKFMNKYSLNNLILNFSIEQEDLAFKYEKYRIFSLYGHRSTRETSMKQFFRLFTIAMAICSPFSIQGMRESDFSSDDADDHAKKNNTISTSTKASSNSNAPQSWVPLTERNLYYHNHADRNRYLALLNAAAVDKQGEKPSNAKYDSPLAPLLEHHERTSYPKSAAVSRTQAFFASILTKFKKLIARYQ